MLGGTLGKQSVLNNTGTKLVCHYPQIMYPVINEVIPGPLTTGCIVSQYVQRVYTLLNNRVPIVIYIHIFLCPDKMPTSIHSLFSNLQPSFLSITFCDLVYQITLSKPNGLFSNLILLLMYRPFEWYTGSLYLCDVRPFNQVKHWIGKKWFLCQGHTLPADKT